MSKTIFPLLIAFLSLWLFGGAYWLSNMYKAKHPDDEQGRRAYRFLVSNGDFKAEALTIFAFQTSDADVIINEEQLSVLEKLATYLDEFKEKQLRLVGSYGQNETNRSNHGNLGIARAESFKYLLVRSGAPETNIVTEGKLSEKLNLNENGLISGGVEFEIFDKDISKTITKAPFLKDRVFRFEQNKYVLSDSNELEIYVAELKQYMVDEKDSRVIVTGFRTSEEQPSIDVLRTKFIEDFFINRGIDIDRMSLELNTSGKRNTGKKVEIKVF